MAMMRLCGVLARRMMPAMEQRMTFSSLSPACSSYSSPAGMPVVCGRGDKRTKKGKRFKGSYGNARPKRDKKIERIKDRVEVPSIQCWSWRKFQSSLELDVKCS